MKLKKCVSLITALLTVSLIAACGVSEDRGNRGGDESIKESINVNDKGNQTVSEEDGDMADIEVIFWTLNTIPSDLDLVEAAIKEITEEKINTTVHLNITEMGNYAQQLNLMLAGNEKLDLMVTLPGDSVHFNSMTSQNQLTDLTELLPEYAPELLETVPESWIEGTSIDGHIYSVPSFGDKATPLCFICRTDVLNETGINADTIKTASDLDMLFAKVKEIHPEITPVAIGNKKIFPVPYTLDNDGNIIKFEGLGEGDNSIICILGDEGAEIQNYYETDEYKATIKKMKEWYDKGYLYKDGATYEETGEALVATGNYFGTFRMQATGTEASMSALCGCDISFIQLDENPMIDTVSLRKFTWAVPSTATEPEAAVKFMNLLYTDAEVLNLLTWGIEDVHYQTLEDGSIDFIEGQDSSNCGYYIGDTTAIIGNGFLAKVRAGQDIDLREKAKNLNLSSNVSRFNGFSYDISGLENEVSGLTNTTEQYRPALACGLYTEEYYNEFIQKLKDNGAEKYLENVQSQLDEWRGQSQEK